LQPLLDNFTEAFQGYRAVRFPTLAEYQYFAKELTKEQVSFRTRIVKHKRKKAEYMILLVEDIVDVDDFEEDDLGLCPSCDAPLEAPFWCKFCGDIDVTQAKDDDPDELDFDNDRCVYDSLNVNGAEY